MHINLGGSMSAAGGLRSTMSRGLAAAGPLPPSVLRSYPDPPSGRRGWAVSSRRKAPLRPALLLRRRRRRLEVLRLPYRRRDPLLIAVLNEAFPVSAARSLLSWRRFSQLVVLLQASLLFLRRLSWITGSVTVKRRPSFFRHRFRVSRSTREVIPEQA